MGNIKPEKVHFDKYQWNTEWNRNYTTRERQHSQTIEVKELILWKYKDRHRSDRLRLTPPESAKQIFLSGIVAAP